jgi:ABC-type transport system substrate-binding protein
LPPLPRHILEAGYDENAPEAFLNHPFWTSEYVGLGPYRLVRWEPGAFLEGVAFAGHQPAPAKIERVRILYSPDPNTVVANLLSNAADIAMDDSLRFQHGSVLRRQWGGDGAVLLSPNVVRYIQVQYRPELVAPRALIDPRTRKALLHAIDRPLLVEALLEGQGDAAETMVSNQMSYYPTVDRAIVKYPYDVRRTEQLMGEAGFTKQGEFFADSAGERFNPAVRSIAGGQEEQELNVVVDAFRRAGVDASATILSLAQSRDGEAQASFSGLNTAQTTLAEDTILVKFLTARIPSLATRWAGSNLGGYSNAEYDRLYDQFNTTLGRPERDQLMVRLMSFINEELPGLPLYYNPRVVAHTADLQGPRAGGDTFNVQEWQFR